MKKYLKYIFVILLIIIFIIVFTTKISSNATREITGIEKKLITPVVIPTEMQKERVGQKNIYNINKEINAIVTSYCLIGTMASGKQVYAGAIACPRRIKLGTKVIIENKEYICEDRLSRRFDDRFDIWMNDCQDSINWGKRELNVLFE